MSHNDQLYQWIDNVSTHFFNLNKSMVMGLALWSFGMVIARSCGLSVVPIAWKVLNATEKHPWRLENGKLLPPKAGQPEPWPGLINFPAATELLC